MFHNILTFAIITLSSFSHAWIFPRNATQPSNQTLTVFQSDLFFSTTASKIQKLSNTNPAFKFHGADIRFSNDEQQTPVTSPFTIHNHSIDYTTDGYYRIALSNPNDWQQLGSTVFSENNLPQTQVSWTISEAKTPPIDALTRLRASGCTGALSGMQLIKTNEVDGKSRVWYRVYGYESASQDNLNTTTAWVSDDAGLSHSVLVYRPRIGTQAAAYLTCDGKVVNTHVNAKI